MAEHEETTQQTGQGTGSQPTTAQIPGQDEGKTQVPFAEFQRTRDRMKAAELEVAQFKAAQKAEEDKKTKEAGEYQKLLAGRDAELAKTKLELSKIRLVSEMGLSAEIADILAGGSEEELKANAEKLVNYMGKRTATPNVPAPQTGAGAGAGFANTPPSTPPPLPDLQAILKMESGPPQKALLDQYKRLEDNGQVERKIVRFNTSR